MFASLFLCLCIFTGAFISAARADELAPILPKFVTYAAPRDMVNLAFQDKDGKPHQLSDFKGQLVLVNLWATWCLPCREELPSLDHLQTVFKNTKFVIVPISLDDPSDADKISAFYALHNIRALPIYKNPDFPLLKQLHPDGLPISYLLTPDGQAVGEIEGYSSWDTPEAANLIEAYLAKTGPKNRQARRVSNIVLSLPLFGAGGAIFALAKAA